MKKALFIQYIEWHFFDAFNEIYTGWKNFLLFTFNYFSIDLLLKTFFSHWHKYSLRYGKSVSPSWYFEVFVFNMMSRIIGMVLRVFMIIIGTLAEVSVFVFGISLLVVWVTLPLILFIGFLFGLRLMTLI